MPASAIAKSQTPKNPACADVVILGLRGHGESASPSADYGIGAQNRAVADRLAVKLRSEGHSVTIEPILYAQEHVPTIDFFYHAWEAPNDQFYVYNQRIINALIDKRRNECPLSKLAIIAYSEGAWHVHSYAGSIIPIANVTILLGDLLHRPTVDYNRQPSDHSAGGRLLIPSEPDPIPPDRWSRVGSYCLPHDIACTNDLSIDAHQGYKDDTNGVASAAADFALTVLNRDLLTVSKAAPLFAGFHVGSDIIGQGPCSFLAVSKDHTGTILATTASVLPPEPQPFRLDPAGEVGYFVEFPSVLGLYQFELKVSGVTIVNHSDRDSTSSLRGIQPIHLPVRLYGTLPLEVTLRSSNFTCSAAGSVQLPGSPTGSPVWVGAVGAVVAGAVLILFLFVFAP
jgi:hypothetical protein